MTDVSAVIERLRQPAYTGENRCRPCTVLNVTIAAVLAVVLAAFSRGGGALVFVLSLGTIYLRGYLVPGTPALTKTYFPEWLLDLFDKNPATTERVVENGVSIRVEAGETLAAGGVLTPVEDGRYSLTPEFREAWHERIQSVGERGPRPADVATMFDADSVTRHSERSFVVDGKKSVRWDSTATLVADVAAATELRSRVDWSRFGRTERTDVLRDLRLLSERCPACGGELSLTEEYVEPCCRRKAQTVTECVCEECGTIVADRATVGTPDAPPTETPIRS